MQKAIRFFAVAVGAVVLAANAQSPSSTRGAQVGVPTNVTEHMLYADDPKEWMRPKKVSVPTYPAQLLTQGVTGYVDLRVRIDEVGAVTAIKEVTSTPKQPAFEDVAKESVKDWRFNAVITRDCAPLLSEGTVRVWFEIKDGKPSVSISSEYGTHASANANAAQAEMLNKSEVLGALRYPIAARRANASAVLYAYAEVDAATGYPARPEVTFVKTNNDSVKNVFETTVKKAMLNLRFKPVTNPQAPHYRVCMPFAFSL